MKNLKIIVILIFTMTSCGGFKEAGKVLRNEKITTTDEFLVKKKEPLVLPPDYNELPEPGSVKESKSDNGGENIQKIFNVKKDSQDQNLNSENSIEKMILKEIKK